MLMKMIFKVVLTVIGMLAILCLVIGLFCLSFVVLHKIFGGIPVLLYVLDTFMAVIILFYGVPSVFLILGHIVGWTLEYIGEYAEGRQYRKDMKKLKELDS